MNKIIVLSEDENLAKYLAPLENQKRFNINIEKKSFELLDMDRSLISDEENIIVLDGTDLSKVKSFLQEHRMSCHAFVLLAIKSQSADLEKICEDEAMLMGVLDITKNISMQIPLFNLALRRVTGIGKQDLAEVNQNLNEVVEFTLNELQRIKSIHEKLVPIRADDLKGISIASKFAAGESSGGEFFDMVKGEQECLVLLSNAKSYVVSSLLLSNFEIFRETKNFSNEMIKKFILNLNDELLSKEIPEKRKEVDVFIAKIDLKTMQIEGYNIGQCDLITSEGQSVCSNQSKLDPSSLDDCSFLFRLSRGEKIMLLSPGIKSNCDNLLGGMNYLSFAKDQINLAPRQALDEVFYQLKRFTNTSFLKDDASVIFFEVKSNVIVQV